MEIPPLPPLKIGTDTQRKEHQAQSDRMSVVFFLVRKRCPLLQQMYFSLSATLFLLVSKFISLVRHMYFSWSANVFLLVNISLLVQQQPKLFSLICDF